MHIHSAMRVMFGKIIAIISWGSKLDNSQNIFGDYISGLESNDIWCFLGMSNYTIFSV